MTHHRRFSAELIDQRQWNTTTSGSIVRSNSLTWIKVKVLERRKLASLTNQIEHPMLRSDSDADVSDEADKAQLSEVVSSGHRMAADYLATRLQVAVNAGLVAAWDWEVATGAVWWNDATWSLLGLNPTKNAASFACWMECIHPDERAQVARTLDEMLKDASVTDVCFDYRLAPQQGKACWVRSRGIILRDSSGAARRMTGCSCDISDIRRAVTDRDEAASLAWALFDNSAIGTLLLDGEGVIQKANSSVGRIIGQPVTSLHGKALSTFVEPRDVPKIERYLANQAFVDSPARGDSVDLALVGAYSRRTSVRMSFSQLLIAGRPWLTVATIIDCTRELESRDRLQELSSRLSLATTGQGIGVWDLDLRTWILQLDPLCIELYGLEADASPLPFAEWMVLLVPEDQAGLQLRIGELLQSGGGEAFELEFRVLLTGGSTHWIRSTGSIVRDANGLPLRAVGLNRDISEMKRQHQQLLLQSSAMNAISNSIFITDIHGRIAWVNQEFTRLTGYSFEEAYGQTPRLLKSGRQPEGFYRQIWSTISSGEIWKGRLINRRKTGDLFVVEQTITPIHDESGAIVNYVAIHNDITDSLKTAERAHRLEYRDALTGMPNRLAFQDELDQAITIAKAQDDTVGLVVLDLDQFHAFNDSLGRTAGDDLLCQVAARIHAQLGENAYLARIGEDEFGVLLRNCGNSGAALAWAESLLEIIGAPYQVDGHETFLGASLGVTTSAAKADAQSLLRQAELALHEARRLGKNRCSLYDHGLDNNARHRFSQESAFRMALNEDRLRLHYQPQLTLSSGRLCGTEALLRWEDPVHGRVSPGVFVPMAEEIGLGVELGYWVLDRALRQAAIWKTSMASALPVAVNVSACQLEQADFANRVLEMLDSKSLEGEDLELEITESMMLRPCQAMRDNLVQLRGHGVKLAVDDFGTGYSSLLSLRDLPVTRLKIDQSFVRGIDGPGKEERIIRAVIGLGKSLDLEVIAEGVETEAQERFLRVEGCGQVQGYRYSPAIPAPDMARFVVP